MANNPKHFKAMLEREVGGLGWTIARVPFVPQEAWSQMLRLRVRGEVRSARCEGFAFRTSLFPYPDRSGNFLLVNKAVQSGAGVALGDVAEFVLEPDMEPRPAELPDELAVLLDDEPGLRAWYDEFSESMRRELGKWVAGVKSEATRRRRAEQMAERLLAAMEGERELPPVLAAAFRRRPKAKLGWGKLTVLQRRQGLLAIFYYKSVEARLRRVETLCDEAEKKAGSGTG